jgi:hypothetical protein
MNIDGYELIQTSEMMPEQYDVYNPAGKQVGYLRLRGGAFRVYFPDHMARSCLYAVETKDHGSFVKEERMEHLEEAINTIKMLDIFH